MTTQQKEWWKQRDGKDIPSEYDESYLREIGRAHV